jgi:protein-tyrosine phosphatase
MTSSNPRQPAANGQSRHEPPVDQFQILFVCTANLCRSVIAERLAIQGLRGRLGEEAAWFTVRSAGTAVRRGAPMHPETAAVLTELGADPCGFAACGLSPELVQDADLILAAGVGHLEQAIALSPRASRRVFLLREFARLAPLAPRPLPGQHAVIGARKVVAAAANLRGRVPYVEPAADAITDPAITGEPFLACAHTINKAVTEVLDAICGIRLPAARARLGREPAPRHASPRLHHDH